jgi:hypothetical protein
MFIGYMAYEFSVIDRNKKYEKCMQASIKEA